MACNMIELAPLLHIVVIERISAAMSHDQLFVGPWLASRLDDWRR